MGDVPVTHLDPDRAREIVADLRAARAGDSYTRATVIAQSRLAALLSALGMSIFLSNGMMLSQGVSDRGFPAAFSLERGFSVSRASRREEDSSFFTLGFRARSSPETDGSNAASANKARENGPRRSGNSSRTRASS